MKKSNQGNISDNEKIILDEMKILIATLPKAVQEMARRRIYSESAALMVRLVKKQTKSIEDIDDLEDFEGIEELYDLQYRIVSEEEFRYKDRQTSFLLGLHLYGKGVDLHDDLACFRSKLERSFWLLRNEICGELSHDGLKRFNDTFYSLISQYDDLILKVLNPLNSKAARSSNARKLNENTRKKWEGYRETYKELREGGKSPAAAKRFMQAFIKNTTGKEPAISTLERNGLKG